MHIAHVVIGSPLGQHHQAHWYGRRSASCSSSTILYASGSAGLADTCVILGDQPYRYFAGEASRWRPTSLGVGLDCAREPRTIVLLRGEPRTTRVEAESEQNHTQVAAKLSSLPSAYAGGCVSNQQLQASGITGRCGTVIRLSELLRVAHRSLLLAWGSRSPYQERSLSLVSLEINRKVVLLSGPAAATTKVLI